MKKQVFRRSFFTIIKAYLAPLFLTALVFALVIVGLNRTEQSSRAEGLRILDESLRKAAAKCYAIEGFYPDDVSYMEEHYGVRVDRAKYAVYYEVFASNVMPDIVVLELD